MLNKALLPVVLALPLAGCLSLGADPPDQLLTLTPARVAPAGTGSTAQAAAALAVLEPSAAQTMAFATLALAELLLVYAIRSPSAPAWRGGRNPMLQWSVLASLAVVAAVVYIPALREPFGTVALAARELGLVAVLAVLPAAVLEAIKWRRRRRPAIR